MRLNQPGNPGRYSCDKCGSKATKGVYTGIPGFEHVCQPCKATLKPSSGRAEPPSLRAARLKRGIVTTAPIQARKGRKLAKKQETVV
jgi:hypothetical protein